MASTETAQPRKLAPTQIEAHVTRLTAVREGLRKFDEVDGRAAECVRILAVAISTLEGDFFPTNAPEEVADPEPEPETIAQVQERERAPGGAAAPKENKGEASAKRAQKPTTGYGSDRGIV